MAKELLIDPLETRQRQGSELLGLSCARRRVIAGALAGLIVLAIVLSSD